MSRPAQTKDGDPRTHAIIGAAMEVHRRLGCGFLEAVYTEAPAIELSERDVPFRREADLPVFYRGRELGASYRTDFICYDDVVVEVKALARLGGVEQAQVINYLKAGRFPTGLLVNFGARSLEYRRYALTAPADAEDPQITPIAQTRTTTPFNGQPMSGQSVSSAESADSSSSPPSADNPGLERGDA